MTLGVARIRILDDGPISGPHSWPHIRRAPSQSLAAAQTPSRLCLPADPLGGLARPPGSTRATVVAHAPAAPRAEGGGFASATTRTDGQQPAMPPKRKAAAKKVAPKKTIAKSSSPKKAAPVSVGGGAVNIEACKS